MDLTRNVMYRDFLLNDEDIKANITPGSNLGSGIAGCVLDSVDYFDVDVVQFTEKKAQQDGMDAGDVFLGSRRVRMAGTLYDVTRALLFDRLWELRKALSPTLAQRESPDDKGYLPLYFSTPTNRAEEYPSGAIDLRVLALPRALQAVISRDNIGGEDEDSLAIPWQATFICKDPSIMAADPQDYDLVPETGKVVNGNFLNRGNYLCPLNMLIIVGAESGTIIVNAGGAINTITIPASTGDRTIRYNGVERIITVAEGDPVVELPRMNWLSFGTSVEHPLISEGETEYTITYSANVTPQAGSHMWFWESYA